MDIDLLHMMMKRDNYIRFKPFVKKHTLTKDGEIIYNAFEEYFEGIGKASPAISIEGFTTWFNALKSKHYTPAQLSLCNVLLKRLETYVPPSSVTYKDVLNHFIKEDYAGQIAEVAADVSNGDATIDDILELCKKYDHEVGRAVKTDDLFATGSFKELITTVLTGGYNWYLNELNISLGPLRHGNFVVIAARPEVGKTTFLASEVSHLAQQLPDNRPVIWVNNEERSNKVLMRVKQAALGKTMRDIAVDPAKAEADYEALMKMSRRILILENSGELNNVKHLVPLFREHNPALIVFDQLDKVQGLRGGEKEGEHMRLGRVYQWARQLSHEYGPVLAASQLSGDASGVRYPGMEFLRESKTDKPGEADAIITIGRDDVAPGSPTYYQRFINVPKNKMDGGPAPFDELQRHGRWEVTILPEIARYEGSY